MRVAKTLETISYVLLGTWIVGMLSSACTSWLLKQTGDVLTLGLQMTSYLWLAWYLLFRKSLNVV